MSAKRKKNKPFLDKPWNVEYFQRHKSDDPKKAVPARKFLKECPVTVRADIIAVLKAVADAPPPKFSGGGFWEAMHDQMKGFYEIRVNGPNRLHYRLFCLLERNGVEVGLHGSSIILISGLVKKFGTKLSRRDYERIKRLGHEYESRVPRSVLT
jgi:hypothetical protein